MVMLRLKFVVSDVDRHGNVRYYFRRRPDPKTRLRGKPGSKIFMETYDRCLAGDAPAATACAEVRPGSFRSVCERYLGSSAFGALDPSTQAWRRRGLEAACEAHGGKLIRRLLARHVRQMRDSRRGTPAAANTLLKALRALFSWAVEHDLAPGDPTREVKRVRYASKGHHSWSLTEVKAYEAVHPLGTKARLALALLLYTAGRREDVVRLGPRHVSAGRMRYVQAKNEHRAPVAMDIPIHPDLAEAIASVPPSSCPSFLETDYGRSFSPNGFGNRFKEWCIQAALPHCSAHGCRKATAARLAERGATPHQIMAITGHRTLEEVERYTREAQRARLADDAMALLPRRSGSDARVPPKQSSQDGVGPSAWKRKNKQAFENPGGAPKGNRTPVFAVRGRRPRPLDDGSFRADGGSYSEASRTPQALSGAK